jgi:3-oxoacyl-[acyl-carrier protein] reductase
MGRFVDKVAIVTGAGRGMGRACAFAFAQEGAAVAFVDSKREGIEEGVRDVKDKGGRAIALPCDVSNAGEVSQAVDRVVATFRTVDILVNNAGVLRTTTPLEGIPEEEWDLIMDVNLKGVFLFSRAVLPIMRAKRYGKIINISSSAGRSTSELGGAHYTASKAGVLGLTRHTAREYGQYGINVNSVCPGLVETPMIREEATQERLKHWLAQIPLGRFAEPIEEADLVLFLASDPAAYITGATIDFNGGSLLI